MERKTKAQLEAMATAELVAHYNVLLESERKPLIKRFESKSKGIARILKWYEEHPAVAATTPPTPAAPAVRESVRTVSPMAVRSGRPHLNYHVKLTPDDAAGKSRVRETSLRGKILAHLRAHGGSAPITALEEAFGRKARGAVMKLMIVNWVTKEQRPEYAAAA